MGYSADFKHNENRENIDNNETEGTRKENTSKNKSKILDFDENLLLPIMIIFLLSKNNLNLPVLDNIKKMTKNFIDIPFNINLSTEEIEGMINALNSVSPYMNPDNIYILDVFSNFLSAMHKISTVKEFKNDMTRNSPDGSRKPLRFKNQREKVLHMLGAFEQFMDEPTKKNMQNFKNALNIMDKFEQTSKNINEKRKNGGSLDIKDMMQLVQPLISSGNFPEAQKIDNMIRMVQIMSALDESDIATDNPKANIKDKDEKDDDDGSFFEFVIDRYDDEEDD
ncbi:hypothetical protein [Paramaledivibacter caminithermalis]|uniref:Uncharacterized protein n=1 Tax=Paramaledivibacter caminithermalis (strain DSM 15212 / CIP 107654 / DViRD3) TaxID=1121301 RepID=A0A1M6KI03_PARC5|nr:hypothetical protein [Paramaledivibacter caminithermalis]SHJ58549.1 hypothetical protein SAMN02745912_00408 [Paramaledivibacter caminithermalis DSM 15212]